MSDQNNTGWRRVTSLRARLAIMLSIAILPLGIVAVFQTSAVITEAQRLERSDLLLRTLRAANAERALLRHAYGVAEALGETAATIGSDNPLCGQVMDSFVAENETIIFAGFIDADGIMRCSPDDAVVDFNGFDDWQSFVSDPRPMVTFNPEGASTGEPVMIVSLPVMAPEDNRLLGAASVSLPGALFNMLLDPEFEGITLALLDQQGTVLASSGTSGQIERLNLVPSDLSVSEGGYTREIQTASGNVDLAVLLPLVANQVYVLGVWEGIADGFAVPVFGTGAPLFPILMWAIALTVALLAIDRLVLRHLRTVRDRMAAFSFDDPGDSFAMLDEPPREIGDIARTYNLMVDRILGDRTELAENLNEKELLLREVHHRVKNNLQLIASMLNIQIRSIPDGESRHILRRMQDRVMGLSSIHKALYSGNTLARVRADRLLQEVLQSTLSIGLPPTSGVETTLRFDPVSLDPDQAVPLTLLTSELTTNALKHVGRTPAGESHIRITLDVSGRDVDLTVESTLGTKVQASDATKGTGLGSQLIEAFVSQLGATLHTEDSDDRYVVTVHCPNLAASSIEEDDLTDDEAEPPLRQAS